MKSILMMVGGALCVAGGLLFSQLLTLFITPVLYTYLDRIGSRFSFGRNRRVAMAPTG